MIARGEIVPRRSTIRRISSEATAQVVVDYVYNCGANRVEMWMNRASRSVQVRSGGTADVDRLRTHDRTPKNRYKRSSFRNALREHRRRRWAGAEALREPAKNVRLSSVRS